MGKVAKAGFGLVVAALLAGELVGVAQAQGKEQGQQLSDKSVQLLVDYAWAMTPAKFTAPDGKVTEVDKSKREQVMVPLDVAREVIRVGYQTARAQVCRLEEEQRANYQTMYRREQAKKWTDQQLLFINQLHLFTVMFSLGKVKITETEEKDKQVEVKEHPVREPKPCEKAERDALQKSIMAYVTSEAPKPAEAKK
jgi:hypothetical protein